MRFHYFDTLIRHSGHTKFAATVWIAAIGILLLAQQALYSLTTLNGYLVYQLAIESLIPLATCTVLVLVARCMPPIAGRALAYFLFFSTSMTSALGLTSALTGFPKSTGHHWYYGLAFYTASLAYLIRQEKLAANAAIVISNPLLLITGPIALFFKSQLHRRFKDRARYYLPYIVLGVFLEQAVATPLTATFHLIERTDVLSSITFAIIFELFVYANFCGLSLLVFGVMGLLGVRVPLNFRQPLSAIHLVDYWKGWHISLSATLKVLFYLPVKNLLGTHAAIFAVFLSSAMWHGVTFNFVLWGFFHAGCFALTLFCLRRKIRYAPSMLMLIGVVVGRLLFLDSDTDRLLEKLTFTYNGVGLLTDLRALPVTTKAALILIAMFVFFENYFRTNIWFNRKNYKLYRVPVVQLVLLVILLSTVSDRFGADYAVYGQR